MAGVFNSASNSLSDGLPSVAIRDRQAEEKLLFLRPLRVTRKQLLVLGATPTRFPVPETNGQNKEKRIPQSNHPYRFHRQRRRKKGRQPTNIAIFSLATQTGEQSEFMISHARQQMG